MRRVLPLALLAVATAACSAPERSFGPPTGESARPARIDPTKLRPIPVPPELLRDLPHGLRADQLPVASEPRFSGPRKLPDLWTEVTGAWLDMDRGARLEEALAERPASIVQSQGVAALTGEQLFGTPEEDFEDALCEPMGVNWTTEHEGESWDVEMLLFGYSAAVGKPEAFPIAMSPRCGATLDERAPADAVAAGICSEAEELSLFRADTVCRACLDEGGGWTACVEEAACAPEGPLVWIWNGVDGRTLPIETHFVWVNACAPAHFARFLVLSPADDDPRPPEAFDQAGWIGYCLPYWLPEIDDVYFGCNGETLEEDREQHVLIEGLNGRLVGARRSGSDASGWWDRATFARNIRLTSGALLEHHWAGDGLGHVSASQDLGGWGLPPLELRPDGEPGDPDGLMARDWVAGFILKQTTRRNGVLVSFFNHNRCAEDAWVGPDERGRYQCTYMNPTEDGWHDDGATWWSDDEERRGVFSFPAATLASTGLPDPDVPGGVAIHVAGSRSYEALQGWTWPHRFEPDLVPMDVLPEDDGSEGTGVLWGQSYRFGKEPDEDFRMIMSSNWRRFHRPGGEP